MNLKSLLVLAGMLIVLFAGTASAAPPDVPEARLIGVNEACGEFGPAPGVFNKDYTYPGERQFDYCRAKGIRVVRLPFKWERVQPTLMQPLDADEMGRLDRVVELAGERDVKLLLDMHNYARYNGELVGTEGVPNAALADCWKRLAEHFCDEDAVFAYGVMNEPHGTKGLWKSAAQAAVDAIRQVDREHVITVCGDGWSGAHSWAKINGDFLLRDPANKLVYEAHQYFDRDNSGTYKGGYDASGAYPTIGADRLRPFFDWLEEHDARGFIGEFGVPGDDPRWLVVLDNALTAMREHGVGGTYWAAGPWWGDYPLSVEPRDGEDRPQMAVLSHHLAGAPTNGERPWIEAAKRADEAARKAREADVALGRRVHDFGDNKESYHYGNEESRFASEAVMDADRKARKITFKHVGDIAYTGVGLFFGALDCGGCDGFHLELRADKPCRIEVKAYDTSGKRFAGSFDVGTKWAGLAIPFADLKSDGKAYDAALPIQKLELQPSTSRDGNTLYLGALRLSGKGS